jgi:hypothetical protein
MDSSALLPTVRIYGRLRDLAGGNLGKAPFGELLASGGSVGPQRQNLPE